MTSVLYDAPGPKAIWRSRILSIVTGLVVLGLLTYAGLALWQRGMWDPTRWDIFNDPLVWQALLRGLWTVVQAAALSAVMAIVLGIVLSLLRMAEHRLIKIPVTVVLEFLRGMPVLLMMLFILLVIPGMTAYWAVVWALTLYNGAIIGEALRSGLVALPRGQREAGLALGLRSLQTRALIEFPQAFRNMLPIIVAQIVVLLKDTALGYIVGMLSLVREGELLAEFFGRSQYYFSIFLVVLGFYLVLNLSVSFLARWLARRRPLKAATPTTVPGITRTEIETDAS